VSTRCDYKSASPRQRRRSVRRHGLLVVTFILIGLFGGLLAYIKGDGTPGVPTAAVTPATPLASAAPVAPPVPAAIAPPPTTPESFKPKYDFYTELPKRQVDIQ
jgi:hypothetical protein